MYEEWFGWISHYWVTLTLVTHFSLSLVSSLHVILVKENERTSLAWIGLVILSPVIGSLIYWIFGINRIKRTAQKKHPNEFKQRIRQEDSAIDLHNIPLHWHPSLISGYAIQAVNCVANNKVEPLINGDIAYPAMLKSINNAHSYIVLSSYIFDYDSLGCEFIDALAQAHQRGVKVNVMLDVIGLGYIFHKSYRALRKRGVKTARFLPAISFSSFRFINLRNHRKILCIDGNVAYVGGMNISKDNLVSSAKHPIDDIHFKVTGPVIDQISQVFMEDWYYATNEIIQFPSFEDPASLAQEPYSNTNTLISRVILDGPDEHHNRVKWTLINALVCAKTSVKIMTPYFIPDQVLMASLHAAALRGVTIEIMVPAHSNIFFLDWVMQANFERIIRYGIKLYKNTRPFEHSKIVIIDDIWSFIGSSNWDARSLEFNFEINLECFNATLNKQLNDMYTLKKQSAIQVFESEVQALPFYKRLRNNSFRLLSPYL